MKTKLFQCICGHMAYWVKYRGWCCMCGNPRKGWPPVEMRSPPKGKLVR